MCVGAAWKPPPVSLDVNVHNDCAVTVEDIACFLSDRIWGEDAVLSIQEKQVVALAAAQFAEEMDLSQLGLISEADWIHYMLLFESGFVRQHLRAPLQEALQAEPEVLHQLQAIFFAEREGDLVSLEAVNAKYSAEMEALLELMEAEVTEQQTSEPLPDRVGYAEFLGASLGRKRSEVLLHMYDLSKGQAKEMAPWVVGQELEAVWHTGTVVFGKEYYYTKDTVFANAGTTSFGKPDRVVHLGFTLSTMEELHLFVSHECKPIFTRETYDVVCNNCNHFTDRVCLFLLGRGAPEEILRQPDILLQSRSIQLARPMLNWWLRDNIVAREAGQSFPFQCRRLRTGEPVPVGRILQLHPERGVQPAVLVQVNPAPALRPGPDDFSEVSSNAGCIATMTTRPSKLECASFFCQSCAIQEDDRVEVISAFVPNGAGQGLIWVSYVRLVLVESGALTGEVIYENVPHQRLSPRSLVSSGEALFLASLRALSAQKWPSKVTERTMRCVLGEQVENDVSHVRAV